MPTVNDLIEEAKRLASAEPGLFRPEDITARLYAGRTPDPMELVAVLSGLATICDTSPHPGDGSWIVRASKREAYERRGDAQDMFHGGGGGSLDDPDQQSVDDDIENLLGGGGNRPR